MRGYFGIGVEGISKEANVGSLVRSTHAFGGSFFFSIAPDVNIHAMRASDTADSFDHMPYYQYDTVGEMDLPQDCLLVGVELVDESVDLPSFRHPTRAAYVFGSEMGSLSPELMEQCAHIVKIPTKFCVNVGVAGALVMYDRMICMGKFAERPVRPGGPLEPLIKTSYGGHRRRQRVPKIKSS
jgi:tRNA G18 (ribose-2'-O)-methylase SpoU